MKKGLLLIGILGTAYTSLVAIGFSRGFGAVVPPVLPIAAADYYFFLSFMTIPLFYMLAFCFSFTAVGLGKAAGVQIQLGDMIAAYGSAVVPPVFVLMFIPEFTLITFFPNLRLQPLGGFAVIPEWLDVARQALAFLWPFGYFVGYFIKAYDLGILKALGITTACFIVYVGLSLIFIR